MTLLFGIEEIFNLENRLKILSLFVVFSMSKLLQKHVVN